MKTSTLSQTNVLCQMKSSDPWGKSKKNMDQINKTDTNDSSSSFYIMLL